MGSLTLSGLLAGAIIAGLAVRSASRGQLEDPEFLRKRLEQIKADDGPPAPAALAMVRVSVARDKNIQPQRSIIGRLVEVRKATAADVADRAGHSHFGHRYVRRHGTDRPQSERDFTRRAEVRRGHGRRPSPRSPSSRPC